jgi:hypothetical protein
VRIAPYFGLTHDVTIVAFGAVVGPTDPDVVPTYSS